MSRAQRFVSTGRPLLPEEIASRENLEIAVRENEMCAGRAELDPVTMTTDKLVEKLPGMAVASSQLDDYDYARFRLEDEELLRAEQEAYRNDAGE